MMGLFPADTTAASSSFSYFGIILPVSAYLSSKYEVVGTKEPTFPGKLATRSFAECHVRRLAVISSV